jgi:2-amino-4-hydroxy-6-hydroxymethyldihydropteridine diphosphokinase
MTTAYLGLGANLGGREATLAGAIAALRATPGIASVRASSLYETEPQGLADQPWFLNCVLEVETDLDPIALLRACQAVEQAFGRERTVRWGPRTLDVDVLLYGDETMRTPDLEVPHPRLHERAFVLVPLCELAPEAEVPGRGRAADLLPTVQDQPVRRVRP